jgi:acetyl-CoA synthetase
LIGNLTGFVCSQNWFGFDPFKADRPSKAVFWSPADWAWTGGLMDALLPTLYFGHPIVASMARGTGGRFDAERAYALMERHQVTNAFLFPTALKMMMKALEHPRQRYRLKLRAIMSAGESAGETVFNWARAPGRDHQRDVRPDRGQLPGGQQPQKVACQARLDRAALSRPPCRGDR